MIASSGDILTLLGGSLEEIKSRFESKSGTFSGSITRAPAGSRLGAVGGVHRSLHCDCRRLRADHLGECLLHENVRLQFR